MTSTALAVGERLAGDLHAVTGTRLRAVVLYGAHVRGPAADAPVHVLAVVRGLGIADLEALARLERGWRRAGLATPLLVDEAEFARSFDAFPIEFGAMLAHHVVLRGDDPFAGLRVDPADLRRACETQVRSHLLHLREGYLETGGDPSAIRDLVARSAAPLLALLTNIARLAGETDLAPAQLPAAAARSMGPAATVFAEVLALVAEPVVAADPARLFPSYLEAVERLAAVVDRAMDQG